MKKTLAMILSLCMMAGTLASCGDKAPDSLEQIKERGVLHVVTEPGFAPMEYTEGENIIGVDMDIAQAIADEIGVDLVVTPAEFSALIPSVNSGKADFAIAGMSMNEERGKIITFSLPYLASGQLLLTTPTSGVTVAADLKDKIVGVQVGTEGESFASEYEAELGTEVVHYQKYPLAVKDLLSGAIDAVIIDVLVAERFVRGNPDTLVLAEQVSVDTMGIVMPKKVDPAMAELVNKVLSEMVESGEIAELVIYHMDNVGDEEE